MTEKQKLNFITIVARIITVFICLMVISLIFAASKEQFPFGAIGFGIRVLLIPGLFYLMWHGTKKIKIGL